MERRKNQINRTSVLETSNILTLLCERCFECCRWEKLKSWKYEPSVEMLIFSLFTCPLFLNFEFFHEIPIQDSGEVFFLRLFLQLSSFLSFDLNPESLCSSNLSTEISGICGQCFEGIPFQRGSWNSQSNCENAPENSKSRVWTNANQEVIILRLFTSEKKPKQHKCPF